MPSGLQRCSADDPSKQPHALSTLGRQNIHGRGESLLAHGRFSGPNGLKGEVGTPVGDGVGDGVCTCTASNGATLEGETVGVVGAIDGPSVGTMQMHLE